MSWQPLPGSPFTPEYALCNHLDHWASVIASRLKVCWDGSAENLETTERSALWHAYALSTGIETALAWPDFMSLRNLWPTATVDERYVFQSAILTMRHNIPFTEEEREALHAEHNEDDWAFRSPTIALRQPDLVERWHEWIWTDDQRGYSLGLERPSTGPSVMLAESCTRFHELTDNGQAKGMIWRRPLSQ